MTIVVDASVALKWVVLEPDSAAASALRTVPGLIAPASWIAEAANGLWKYVTRGELGASEAEKRLLQLRAAPVTGISVDEDIEQGLRLAFELSHPVYDCLYLALALRKDVHVVTADRRFSGLSGRRANLAGRIRLLA